MPRKAPQVLADRSAKAIGARLTLVRRMSKLNQKQFARRLGVSQGSLSAWESGARSLGLQTAHTVCDHFYVTLDYLFRDERGGLDVNIEHALRDLKSAD